MTATVATLDPRTTWTRGRDEEGGYLTRRPTAASMQRTIRNVAANPVGTDTSFGMGAAHVEVWVPRPATWVFTLIEVTPGFYDIERLRTIAIHPGGGKALQAVYTIHGGELDGSPCIAGEFYSAEAAIGFALEWVTGPVLAAAQYDPDPCGV